MDSSVLRSICYSSRRLFSIRISSIVSLALRSFSDVVRIECWKKWAIHCAV
jgi:hypothetical protein